METDKNQEPSNSNFRELTLDELKALSKEEVDKYMKWYVNYCDIYFEKSLKGVDQMIEEFERLANQYSNDPTDENYKKLEGFVNKEM